MHKYCCKKYELMNWIIRTTTYRFFLRDICEIELNENWRKKKTQKRLTHIKTHSMHSDIFNSKTSIRIEFHQIEAATWLVKLNYLRIPRRKRGKQHSSIIKYWCSNAWYNGGSVIIHIFVLVFVDHKHFSLCEYLWTIWFKVECC